MRAQADGEGQEEAAQGDQAEKGKSSACLSFLLITVLPSAGGRERPPPSCEGLGGRKRVAEEAWQEVILL